MQTEERKTLDADDLGALDDEDFAYIDSNGDRHLPINDAEHVRAALARFDQTEFESDEAKDAAAKKIVDAAKKFDIIVDPDTPVGKAASLESKSSSQPADERSRKPRRSREMALQTKCRRSYTAPFEIRKVKQASGAELIELSGQVIGYGTPYEVNDMFGSFTETIHYGACTALLADPALDVAFLVGHDSSAIPLARTGAKAELTLEDTPEGLRVKALVDPRMTGANDLLIGLENGTISQMSVGMQVDPAGDVWSGEDDYGMANVRDIYRLAKIFDASAVAFPANPDTELELASARMAEFPPEITVRTQRLAELAKRGRQGVITEAESDDLLQVIRALFSSERHDEGRSAPTKQDTKVADAIVAAHQATAAAIAAQMKDPDNNTDPIDKKVMGALQAAHEAVGEAMAHQAKDGTPDALKADQNGQIAGSGGEDGTQGGSGPIGGTMNQDGTGSRSIEIEIDRDLLRLSRRPLAI